MKKRLLIIIPSLLVLIVLIGGVKALQIRRMIAAASEAAPPALPVTTATAQKASWESLLAAVGSCEAVQGVRVTGELSGKVVRIAFAPGTSVRAGALLVQQDVSTETAQLRAVKARVALARTNLARAKKLLAKNAVPVAEHDAARAAVDQAAAEADTIRATIRKKTIRAPFAGRLGIREINLGQVINPGDEIVSLQSIDPIHINFRLPQQYLSRVQSGLTVRVTNDALPGQSLEGKITAVSPQVDMATRNVEIQATLANKAGHLRPGMFANVSVVLPARKEVLAVPATAILHAPYSDSVFVVTSKAPQEKAAQGTVRQQFVRLGEKRGDYVAIVKGLEPGQDVVSTGVFKLRDGQPVRVDNSLSLEFKLAPEPKDS